MVYPYHEGDAIHAKLPRICAVLLLTGSVAGCGKPPSIREQPDGTAGVSASLAKRTAERYVALVNAGDFDAVGDLFAEHARHLPPPPARGFIEGREAILAFYKSFAQPLGARIVPINSVADGNSCVIEFDATTRDRPDGGNPSMAIFTVDDDGKIVRMAIYRRELPEPTARPNRK